MQYGSFYLSIRINYINTININRININAINIISGINNINGINSNANNFISGINNINAINIDRITINRINNQILMVLSKWFGINVKMN